MGFFKKSTEEDNDALDPEIVIESRALSSEMIWESPIKKFNSNTKVIVRANSEAIFLNNGAMVSVFDKGGAYEIGQDVVKHEMFECDVYFVNKTVHQQIFWGTSSKIDFQDAETGMYVTLGASGTLTMAINNTQKVFQKMVGLAEGVTTQSVSDFFRSKIALFVKDVLARKLVTEQKGFYALSTDIKNLSMEIKAELAVDFNDYGIEVFDFVIENLIYPDEVKKLMADLARTKYILKEEGTSHEQLHKEAKEHSDKVFHVLEEAVKPAPIEVKNVDNSIFCNKCGAKLSANAKFCNECGANLTVNGKICAKCGAPAKDTDGFCNKCGAKL